MLDRNRLDNSTWYQGAVPQGTPIERLADPKLHEWVLEQLNRRIKASEREMTRFYPRWRIQERKVQAYMSLPDYEQILKDMNNSGKPPAPAIITFPYQYATISTIVTYLARVFLGQTPIFPLGASSPGSADRVKNMETILQYQADYTRLVMRLYQFFLDGEIYGVCAARNIWTELRGFRTTWQQTSPALQAVGGGNGLTQSRTLKTLYAGAEVENIDPFMFFPDPTVPMCEVAQKGEFAFWRNFTGWHNLVAAANQGQLKYIDKVEPFSSEHSTWFNLSNRNLLAQGDAHAGRRIRGQAGKLEDVFMEDQGSIVIIPDDWGLGPETYLVKYLFTVINRKQICQAVAQDNDHDAHPLVCSEPYTMGYAFGSPALTDYTGQIQDIMSWFLNSHIENVRAVLNDSLVVDPSKIELADLKRTGPGRIIRLRPQAIGSDVRQAVFQLPLQDVTRNHMADMSAFMKIGDTISSVTDNLRGVQNMGGRKSATEVRTSAESGATRLASHAQLYSAQSICELARQMTSNTQQYMNQEVYLKLLGSQEFAKLGPLQLMGDFVFPIQDGTLPSDKTMLLQEWKEIIQFIMQDQEMRMSYSLPKIFEYVAGDLGGARNVSTFRMNPGMQADRQMFEDPNMVPLREAPQMPQQGAGGATQRLGVPQQIQAPRKRTKLAA